MARQRAVELATAVGEARLVAPRGLRLGLVALVEALVARLHVDAALPLRVAPSLVVKG